MPARLDDILQAVGGTPIVRLNKLAPPGINIFAKLESFNPMGSVKDRLALGIIEDAERRGMLKPGQTVIEATSGNTGIGLAMVCGVKGYPLVVVMGENFSVERRKLMRFLGAKVVLTPAALRGTGTLAKAEELAATHGWFLCRQFDNEANADMHSRTTAPEILAAFEGERLDYFVTGYGTGGTLKGVGRVLRTERPDTRIIVCEPDNSPVLGSGIAQSRNPDGSVKASHPSSRPHVMQGWSPDFIPKLTEDAVTMKLVDQVVPINGARRDATGARTGAARRYFRRHIGRRDAGRRLAGRCLGPARREPAVHAARHRRALPEHAPVRRHRRRHERRGTGDFPFDAGRAFRCARADAGCRRDATAPVEAAAEPAPEVSPEVEAFVKSILADREQPLVLFALEWCEFCWSLRKLFARCSIPYRSVDLDSTAYQRDDRGGQIRALLAQLTGSKTIPQVFVGGEYLGGCTETMDAFAEGRLQQLLARHGVRVEEGAGVDPQSLLPGWLHPR